MATNDSTPRTIEIQLTKGYVAIVDEQDADLALLKWTAKAYDNGAIYAIRTTRTLERKRQHLHTVVLERILGRQLTEFELADHIDRNPLNNQRFNIRLANRTQNNRNVGIQRNNTTGYKGVQYLKSIDLFRVRITVNCKELHCGYFYTAEDAASVYNHFAIIHYGDFAYLNNVDNWQSKAEFLITNPISRRERKQKLPKEKQ